MGRGNRVEAILAVVGVGELGIKEEERSNNKSRNAPTIPFPR
jgi:hypothetical protein